MGKVIKKKEFKTMIFLLDSSEPMVYEKALNCYVKGQMYCVMFKEGGKRRVHKYPFINIFRIDEEYREEEKEEA